MVVARYWEERVVGSDCLMGVVFQFRKMKKLLERDGGDGCTQFECT